MRAGDRRTVLSKDLYKTVPVGDYVGPTEDKTFPPPPVPQPAPRGLLIGKFEIWAEDENAFPKA